MKVFQTALLTSLAAGALGTPLEPDHVKRANVRGTATVNLATPLGTPQHRAAGFLYGIPIAQDQIPDHFYTEMGFNYGRAGGGSEPAPARGWAYGSSEFTVGFDLIFPRIRFLYDCLRTDSLLPFHTTRQSGSMAHACNSSLQISGVQTALQKSLCPATMGIGRHTTTS